MQSTSWENDHHPAIHGQDAERASTDDYVAPFAALLGERMRRAMDQPR